MHACVHAPLHTCVRVYMHVCVCARLPAKPCFLQAIPGGPKPAPGVNVILDLVGASHFPANLQSLTIEGRLLLVGLPSGSKAEMDLAVVSGMLRATLDVGMVC